ncbi:uncharacterized protein V1510DRAFT_438716 [Dipodascopsis tothii]|uniref:uncharacterized protein n=1 Tax=Dipodascopsis tothii TaxID=44089 RepID=UPI0034D0040A
MLTSAGTDLGATDARSRPVTAGAAGGEAAAGVDYQTLAAELRAHLDELEAELEEGDITTKGYEKRKNRLRETYAAVADTVDWAGERPGVGHQYSGSTTSQHSYQSVNSFVDSPIEAYTGGLARPGSYAHTYQSSSDSDALYMRDRSRDVSRSTSRDTSRDASRDARDGRKDEGVHYRDTLRSEADFSEFSAAYGAHVATSPTYFAPAASPRPDDGAMQPPLVPRGYNAGGIVLPPAKFKNLASLLRDRTRATPKANAILTLDAKGKEASAISWDRLSARAEKVGQVIREKSGLYRGDRVALYFRDTDAVDFAVAMLGCFLAGVVAVPVNTATEYGELNRILNASLAHLALTTDVNLKAFHRNFISQGQPWPRGVEWWKINEFGTFSSKADLPALQVPDLAYIEFASAPTGELRGSVLSHKTLMHQMTCLGQIVRSARTAERAADDLAPEPDVPDASLTTVSYLDPRRSIGLIMGLFLSIYLGHTLVWVPQSAPTVPGLYAHLISRLRPSILLADYPGLKQAVYNYQSYPLLTRNFSKRHAVDLSSVAWCFVDCLTVDAEFHEILTDRWLRPLGNAHAHEVVAPLLTLAEHGGMAIAVRDWLRGEDRLGAALPAATDDDYGPSDLSELLLDKAALATNTVRILSTKLPRGGFLDEPVGDTIRVGAFGYPLPDATLAIVDPEPLDGACRLVPELTVGEIWVDSPSLSGGFWGLPNETTQIFHAVCRGPAGLLPTRFLRTGRLGFTYAGKVYVVGLYEDRLRRRIEPAADGARRPQFRYNYTQHLVQTIMQNVPRVFDCTAFDVFVSHEHLLNVLVESPLAITAPDTPGGPPAVPDADLLRELCVRCVDKLRAVHDVRVYCMLVTAPNTLPRSLRNGRLEIGTMLCRLDYERGTLPAVYAHFGGDHSLLNLPADVGADDARRVWSLAAAAARQGQLAHEDTQYTGVDDRDVIVDDRSGTSMAKFPSVVHVLQWRVANQPEELAYCTIDSKSRESRQTTWKKFDGRVAAVAALLRDKAGVRAGDRVVLLYSHSEDYVHAVLACLCLGAVAVPVAPLDQARLGEDVPALLGVLDDFRVRAIAVNGETEHALKTKAIAQYVKQSAQIAKVAMQPVVNTAKAKAAAGTAASHLDVRPEWLAPGRPALVWVHWTADNRPVAVSVGHDTLLAMCKTQKETCQLSSTQPIVGCIRSTSGVGFLQTCVLGIYVGAATYLISPADFAVNPSLFFLALARYKVKDGYATRQMLEHGMALAPMRGYNLRETKNLMVACDGRPDAGIFTRLGRFFTASGLEPTAISVVYSHALNPMVTTRSYIGVDPVQLRLDLAGLRRGLVVPLDRAAPGHSVVLHDSGMVPVNTQIAIVNPESRRLCRASEYGEIWVASDACATGFYGSTDPFDAERFAARTADGDRNMLYTRTGDLGFLRTVSRRLGADGALVDLQVLFVLGAIGDTFEIAGLNHFPIDIETTVEAAHRDICPGGSAVFQADRTVVVVVEVARTTALAALVPIVVNAVLDCHGILTDVVAFVARGDFPRSRLGEKQRSKILASWINRKLKTLAVFNAAPPRGGRGVTRPSAPRDVVAAPPTLTRPMESVIAELADHCRALAGARSTGGSADRLLVARGRAAGRVRADGRVPPAAGAAGADAERGRGDCAPRRAVHVRPGRAAGAGAAAARAGDGGDADRVRAVV